jgi:hypothetical protein
MAAGDRNLARLSPMILTGALAIIVGAILWGVTDMGLGGAILFAVLILAIGLVGVWMLDKRRQTAA